MIPYTAPSEPTNLQAEASSHSGVKVTWGPPSDNGGANIELYKLQVTGPGLSSPITGEFSADDERKHVVDNLVNNTNYT